MFSVMGSVGGENVQFVQYKNHKNAYGESP